MLKSNVFIHKDNDLHQAVLYDTYSCKLFSLPFEMADRAYQGCLTVDEESAVNALVSDSHSKAKCKNIGTLESLRLLITNKCNFKCDYCFADAGSYGLARASMSPQMARDIIDYFYSSYDSILQISFFGGEPLIASNVIACVCDYIKSSYPDKHPSYSIVTNASLLDDNITNVLAKNSISVVASVDGPRQINDLHRVYKSGVGTFNDVDANLRQYGSRLRLSVEATYTSSHVDGGLSRSDLHQYLSSRYGVSRVIIADASIEGDEFGKKSIEPSEFPLFLRVRDFFDGGCMLFSDEICNLIRTFIVGGNSLHFCGAGFDRFTVDMTGNVYPCHLFVGDTHYIISNVGSVSDERRNPGILDKSSAECRDCCYRAFCLACTYEMTRGRELCRQNKEGIDYFLHRMLDLFITNRSEYDLVLRRCLDYVHENRLPKTA
ncbi:MAG: 4Fe-4S cluster-binding domain-containing protein [Olsenella sp.]|jgi:uncharacterized protein|nr:4Fe-4S cluster-binding domain-containing protein [Olsenella sp.]MCI2186854.1 4Fe-4S cluster-binding domain-containing protein [Olsenella sp.]